MKTGLDLCKTLRFLIYLLLDGTEMKSAGKFTNCLSKLLLKDAIGIMSSSFEEAGEDGMSCSLLHASVDFRPVYSKVGGYESVRSEWSVVPVNLQRLTNKIRSDDSGDEGWHIRQARFPEDAIQLQRLHAKYSENRFITVVRSVQYWKEYVDAELGDTLWVMCGPAGGDDSNNIMGWMSVRTRGDRYQLREFGMNTSSDESALTSFVVQRLLGVTLDQVGEIIVSEDKEVSLLIPTFILSEMKQEIADGRCRGDGTLFLNIDEAMEENDDGWMYVNFDRSRTPSVLELTTRETDPIPHLIWPTDSF